MGETLELLHARMLELNKEISEDRSLGPQFRIGHSYVTPSEKLDDPKAWFRDIVETEIGPLLDEYWFDAPERTRDALARLRDGL